jgi:hypothetical protein
MRRLGLIALLLAGCAYHYPLQGEYLYGKVDRPYSAIPKYLQEPVKPEAPAQVCAQCPPDTRTRL